MNEHQLHVHYNEITLGASLCLKSPKTQLLNSPFMLTTKNNKALFLALSVENPSLTGGFSSYMANNVVSFSMSLNSHETKILTS